MNLSAACSECGRCGRSVCVCPDPRAANCVDLVEFVSTAPDADSFGVGTSPYLGDTGQTGVAVPSVPTEDPTKRYLIRLAGVDVPSTRAIRLVSLRQMIELRSETEEEDETISVAKIQQVSPFWHFTDGNVSWHLRWETNRYARRRSSASQQPGTSPEFFGLGAALIYQVNLADSYTPLNAGIPPGAGVDSLGTWHDIRFPWHNSQPQISSVLYGPGRLVFYASVKQTRPDTRPAIPSVDPSVLSPEDRFVLAFPNAQYGRVGGAITVELFPECPQVPPRCRPRGILRRIR